MILLICGKSEKLFERTYLQNRNRLTDFKNKLMVTKVEKLGRRDKLGGWININSACGKEPACQCRR